jgi:HK97 gp10 family phage protein
MEMADQITFKAEGFKELNAVLMEMAQDFGYIKAGRQVLIKGVKLAMDSVAISAKANAPYDPKNTTTPHLRDTIRVSGRFPNNRDKRSAFYNKNDVAIGEVSVRTDKRGISQEFGNHKTPPHPYLRNSLESNSQRVIDVLGSYMTYVLEKYKSKKV